MGLHNPGSPDPFKPKYHNDLEFLSSEALKQSKESWRKLSSLCCLGTVLSAQQRGFVPDQKTLPHTHALSFGELSHTPSTAEEIQGRIDSNLGQADMQDSRALPCRIKQSLVPQFTK